jgi:hypothetical protein
MNTMLDSFNIYSAYIILIYIKLLFSETLVLNFVLKTSSMIPKLILLQIITVEVALCDHHGTQIK